MAEHLHYDEDAIVNPDTRHEESDINVRALFLFVGFFIVFAIVTHFGLWLMFNFFVRIENGRTSVPLTQIQRPPDAGVPVEPRLQPFPGRDARGVVAAPMTSTPVTDMEAMRAAEEKVLQHYGWIDQRQGTVHVPIEQAKQMLLQRGLPVAAQAAQATEPLAPVVGASSPASVPPVPQPAANQAASNQGSAKP